LTFFDKSYKIYAVEIYNSFAEIVYNLNTKGLQKKRRTRLERRRDMNHQDPRTGGKRYFRGDVISGEKHRLLSA